MERLTVDAEICAGCRCCELACSYRHEGVFSPALSRVSVLKEDRYGMDYPVFCRQCEPCPAVEACPEGALVRSDGVVRCDEGLCTGCGVCVDVCSYGAVRLDGSLRPLICDLCGGAPACVDRCPTGALVFGGSGFFSERPGEVFRRLMRGWGIGG
jgi:Fe-S-cluster-containing hydrogenase component 2